MGRLRNTLNVDEIYIDSMTDFRKQEDLEYFGAEVEGFNYYLRKNNWKMHRNHKTHFRQDHIELSIELEDGTELKSILAGYVVSNYSQPITISFFLLNKILSRIYSAIISTK